MLPRAPFVPGNTFAPTAPEGTVWPTGPIASVDQKRRQVQWVQQRQKHQQFL